MAETHTILKKPNSQEFIDHQNLVDEDIKWTTKGEVVTHIPKKVPNAGQEEGPLGVRGY